MDRDKIIDGLKMTRDLCVFDPSTGEEIEPHLLNDINRATYDACKGALEILERLDTDSDIISRQAAIDALDKRFDKIPMEQTTEILELRKDLRKLPSAQLAPDQNGDLWITVPDIDEVTCIYVQESKSKFCRIFYEEKEQPERIVRCKDCKHWIPYDWMFSEVWRSKNMADYPEDEIGCNYCDMTMKANDFCSRAERRGVTT